MKYENIVRNHLDDFKAVDSTLSQLGFTDQKKFTLYKLLACILHLGNIKFVENFDGNIDYENDLSKIWFESSAELLEIEPKVLENALFHRRLGVKDDVM